MIKGQFIFLDDVRDPRTTTHVALPLFPWTVVRDFNAFKKTVEDFFNEYQMAPEFVAFDHDLAPEHYRPSMYDEDKHYSAYYTDGTFQIPTGYHAAQWLVEFCKEKKVKLPRYTCHSMNPLGRENIYKVLGQCRREQAEYLK